MINSPPHIIRSYENSIVFFSFSWFSGFSVSSKSFINIFKDHCHIVTTLRHIDIVMLVHKICNNGWQRSLKPPISEDGQTLPTRLQPADCVSAEPAGRQADRAGLRAGGPGEAALPPGHAAGHLGGSQEVSRGTT